MNARDAHRFAQLTLRLMVGPILNETELAEWDRLSALNDADLEGRLPLDYASADAPHRRKAKTKGPRATKPGAQRR